MHPLIEGAVTLYDDEASSLFHLGLEHHQTPAAHTFEAIGTGLFELRSHILTLQEMYLLKIHRQ